ncbi:hypothetical protein B7486_01905 [cyanobacterium TDX16]|nr:hypothetical protein B7486_01905 [cyanobacterium TDX16]
MKAGDSKATQRYSWNDRVLLAGLFALLMAVIVWRAAVTEDAYITFRVVDNAINGYGLRWNVHERVQAYTNPLWMLLHIPLYALWDNVFYITLFLSFLCTVLALTISVRTVKAPASAAAALLLLPLTISMSFTEYSTSGLENPLTHLLFACFGWAVLRATPERFWLYVSTFSALSLVNRLDTVVFYGPILLCLALARRQTLRIKQCLIGALPFVGWELFSLFYYGFPFPNTKYAKLDGGIDQIEYIVNGVRYLRNLVALDVTSAVYAAAAVFALPVYKVFVVKDRQFASTGLLYFSLGILLYSLYIIYVGGTRGLGRFWSFPVFASAWLLYAALGNALNRIALIALIGALIATWGAYPDDFLRRVCRGCFKYVDAESISLRGALAGTKVLPEVERTRRPVVMVGAGIGTPGYTGGPSKIIVDTNGLADPLLARLPSKPRKRLFTGHLKREVPMGYVHAISTGSLEEMDSALAQYYEKLRLIVSGDLFDGKRIYEIINFNLGRYDYLLEQYIDRRNRGWSDEDAEYDP